MEHKTNTTPILRFELDTVGIDTATITVKLCKEGGTEYTGSGAKTEIGSKLYGYAATAGDTDTAGVLSLAGVVAGESGPPMAYQIVTHTRGEVMAAIAALIAPDNAGIAAIKAKTDASALVVLASLSVPAESPALIIPAPGVASVCHVYGYFREMDGTFPTDGTVVTFQLPNRKLVAGGEVIVNRKKTGIIKRKTIDGTPFAVLTWTDDAGVEHNYVPLIRTDQIAPVPEYQVNGVGLTNARLSLTAALYDIKTLSQS